MWNEAKLLFYALLIWGFLKRWKWLLNYFKNWWFMMKVAWKKPDEIVGIKNKKKEK